MWWVYQEKKKNDDDKAKKISKYKLRVFDRWNTVGPEKTRNFKMFSLCLGLFGEYSLKVGCKSISEKSWKAELKNKKMLWNVLFKFENRQCLQPLKTESKQKCVEVFKTNFMKNVWMNPLIRSWLLFIWIIKLIAYFLNVFIDLAFKQL